MQINLGSKLGKHEVKPLQVAKKTISYVAAYGAGVIIYSIIQKHLPEGMKLHTRLAVVIGAWALANMTKDQISSYTDKTFDDTVELVEKLKVYAKEFRDEIEAKTRAA